jgi:hypothetical protein
MTAVGSVLAHEVSGGAGAAAVSTIASIFIGIVLLLLIALVFARRSNGDNHPEQTDRATSG